jgi:hypothetical protein
MMIEKFLKWIGLIIALIGLILGVLDLKGVFSHLDREHMVQLILSTGRVASSSPGFSDFIKKFPPPKGWKESDITGLAPSTLIQSGGVVTPIGPLIYVGVGKQTRRVANFDDLVEWSQESSYPWISWIVTAVGWFICGIGLVLESFGKKKRLKVQVL